MAVGLEDMILLSIVTMLACYQLAMCAERVGRSRRKFKIDPPCMDGDPEFVRTVRAQQNTLEFFPIFMGCLWVCGLFFNEILAAVLGIYYLYLREEYFKGYVTESRGRVKPFKKSAKVLRVYLWLCVCGMTQTALLTYTGLDVMGTTRYYLTPWT